MVVGERNPRILKEGEHGQLVLVKPEQEVLGLGVFWSSPAFWTGRGKDGIFLEALAEEVLELGGPGGELNGDERAVAFFLGEDSAVHPAKQKEHGFGPDLPLDLGEEDELAQEVGVAETMQAVELEIGGQTVVDETAGETGEDGEVLDSFDPAFAADAEPGEELGAGDMEPVKFSGDAEAGFIGVGDGGFGQKVGHAGFKGLEGVEGGGDSILNGGLAEGRVEEIGHHLGDAVQGDQLLDAPVDQ